MGLWFGCLYVVVFIFVWVMLGFVVVVGVFRLCSMVYSLGRFRLSWLCSVVCVI